MPRAPLVAGEATMMEWIDRIHAQGIRRPGYPADRWAEQCCHERFVVLGLQNVRLEPVELPFWEARKTVLQIDAGRERFDVACCALPFSASASGLVADLAPFDAARTDAVRGKASLYDATILRVPAS